MISRLSFALAVGLTIASGHAAGSVGEALAPCPIVAVPAVQSEPAEARFMRWLARNGALGVDHLELVGRTVRTTTAVAAGDELFVIPERLMLSLRTPPSCLCPGVLAQLAASASRMTQGDALILLVAGELARRDESPWHPYLALLPAGDDLPPLPVFWSEAAWRLAQGPNGEPAGLRAEVAKQRASLEQLLRYAQQVPELRVAGQGAMRNAFAWVQTRAWLSTLGPHLVPLADFLNHNTGAHPLELTARGSRLRSGVALAPDSEIFDTYDFHHKQRSHIEMAAQYGFIEANVPARDTVQPPFLRLAIPLGALGPASGAAPTLPGAAGLSVMARIVRAFIAPAWERELRGAGAVALPHGLTACESTSRLTLTALQGLRLLAMNQGADEDAVLSGGRTSADTAPVSLANERAALRHALALFGGGAGGAHAYRAPERSFGDAVAVQHLDAAMPRSSLPADEQLALALAASALRAHANVPRSLLHSWRPLLDTPAGEFSRLAAAGKALPLTPFIPLTATPRGHHQNPP
jgi:hypothetical protein